MPCPDPMTLQRLLHGQLPEVIADSLAQHLEECEQCVRAAGTHTGDDTIVAAARAQAEQHADGEAVEELIVRLTDVLATIVGETSSMQHPQLGASWQTLLDPPQAADELGRLERFRVLKVLGSGGMGVVFEAEDTVLQCRVALKTLHPALAANPLARLRFEREVRATAALSDERIVAVQSLNEHRGIPFFSMALLRGQSLEERLRAVERATGSRVLPLGEAVLIAAEVARGLAAAHAHGLVHRDIKPGNIFLATNATDGAAGAAVLPTSFRVKILDFGLARAIDDRAEYTQPGTVVGTPAYLAPEQLRGEPIDARCDLFSLGCMLYRMTTGRTPFVGVRRFAGEAQPPRQLNPELPAELADLIEQMLDPDPARRPASAEQVATRLERVGAELSSVSIAAPKRRRRWPVRSAVTAATLLAALLAGIIYVRTDRGEFVVDVADADVAVALRESGGITLHDRANDRTYHLQVGKQDLPSGDYEIDVHDPAGNLEFSTRRFTIRRGQETRVSVFLRGAAPPGPLERWITKVRTLPGAEQVAALAEKLRELNPGFDGHIGARFEDGKAVEIHFLTDQVTDLTPVPALADLEMLVCRGSESAKGHLADLGPLRRLDRLRYLDFSANRVKDLSPLRGLKLRDLIMWANPVEDLSPLRDLPLRWLDINYTFVSDLWPLRDLPLTKLFVKAPYANDFWPLSRLPLQELQCDYRPLRHPAVLRGIKSLEKINGVPADEFWKADDERRAGLKVWRERVAALPAAEQVSAVTAKLRELNPEFKDKIYPEIDAGAIASLMIFTDTVSDITPVQALTKLQRLTVRGTAAGKGRLSDLDPVREMTLEYLECGGNEVADLSPLSGTKIRALSCWNTWVRDLTPLRSMPIFFLDCRHCRIKDLAPLRGLGITHLFLQGNPVKDLAPLASMNIYRIEGDFEPGRDAEVLRSIKTLERINNQPAAEFLEQLQNR